MSPQGEIWDWLEAGWSHSCGRLAITEVNTDPLTMCWGRGHEGQLRVPKDIEMQVRNVALGQDFTCALTLQNRSVCFGSDQHQIISFMPDEVWFKLAAGDKHMCGITKTGMMKCWGLWQQERIKYPYIGEEYEPTWSDVDCNLKFCCAILTDESMEALRRNLEDNIMCWGGLNMYGERSPPEGRRSGRTAPFDKVRLGASHACARTKDRDLVCWGNSLYQMHDIPHNSTNGQVFKEHGIKVKDLCAHGHHSCMQTTDDEILCWGRNFHGQVDVPFDWYTEPPAVTQSWLIPGEVYWNDPQDITDYDPSLRRYRIDALNPPLVYTQHVRFEIFLPEFAMPGTVELIFELMYGVFDGQFGLKGQDDPYAPHTVFFTSEFERPGYHNVSISAFDLTLWHDPAFGPYPFVSKVESKMFNGRTEHRLQDDCYYVMTLRYRDILEHPYGRHVLDEFKMEYDVDTLPARIHAPSEGILTKQDLNFTYTLDEDMLVDSVWITFTFVRGLPDTPAASGDPDSPHEIQLPVHRTKKGRHELEIDLLDFKLLIPHNTTSSDVGPYMFHNGDANGNPQLLAGGTYKLMMVVEDLYRNGEQETVVNEFDVTWDFVTDPIELIWPKALTDPLTFQYVIPEICHPTTLKFELSYLQTAPGKPGVPDAHSPHEFGVVERLEGSSAKELCGACWEKPLARE
jgi:hypothetical protein